MFRSKLELTEQMKMPLTWSLRRGTCPSHSKSLALMRKWMKGDSQSHFYPCMCQDVDLWLNHVALSFSSQRRCIYLWGVWHLEANKSIFLEGSVVLVICRNNNSYIKTNIVVSWSQTQNSHGFSQSNTRLLKESHAHSRTINVIAP